MTGARGWLWVVVREQPSEGGGAWRAHFRATGDTLSVRCECGEQLECGEYPRHASDAEWLQRLRRLAAEAGWTDARCPACVRLGWTQLALPGVVRRG